MDELLRALGLITFGITATWFISVVLGRMVAKRGLAVWVTNRAGATGRVLLALGIGLVGVGFSQGTGATGSSLILFGSLLLMAGTWIITTAP